MIRQSDINLILILSKLFNGHNDLIHKIIYFKRDLELNTIKDEIIELNFYNWLNHDILIRSSRNMIPYYHNYYLDNLNNLGLIENDLGIRRIKSLKECFQSKWWLTTEKNNFEWREIHNIIKIIPNIAISKNKFYMDNDNNDVIQWISPKINNLNNIFNFIGDRIEISNDNLLNIDTYYLINDYLVNIS